MMPWLVWAAVEILLVNIYLVVHRATGLYDVTLVSWIIGMY